MIIHFLHFQISTHSLTRRLTLQVSSFRYRCNISTHSLTRRLTLIERYCRSGECISTHSLTRRLTKMREALDTEEIIFQLTASQGG